MTFSRLSTSAGQSADVCRRACWLARAKVAGLKHRARDITLALLCLSFAPLIYAASLATVAAMLVLTCSVLILARQHSAPILSGSILRFAVLVPLLVWMLASAAWSLDSAASVEVTFRLTVL